VDLTAPESGPETGSVNFDRIADRYDDTRGGLARRRTIAAHLASAAILLSDGGTCARE